jgi:hypothetical protein
MPRFSDHLERVHLFADGELTPDEHAAFQDHLSECLACQRELETVLVLRARLLDLSASQAGRTRRRRLLAVALGAAAATLTLAVVMRSHRGGHPRPELGPAFDLMALNQRRPILERLTYQPAARHRPPPAVMRAARPTAAVAIGALVAARAAGDAHGELALWLWAGDLDEASATAERLARDPDSANDRAVLAMRRGRLAEARAVLDAVVAREPASGAALWNRALLFERLDDRAAAIRDYEAVAALQEPGWGDEARARATLLRER